MKNNILFIVMTLCLGLSISSCKSSKDSMAEATTGAVDGTSRSTSRTASQAPPTDTKVATEPEATPVSAPTNRRGNSIVKMDEIGASLGLTDKQVDKLKSIQSKYGKKIEAVRKKGGQAADRTAVMNQIKSLREQQNNEIQSILSKDEYEQYVELQMARGGSKGSEMKKGKPKKETAMVKKTPEQRAADRAERFNKKLIKNLELSKDQTTAFLEIQQKYEAQIKEQKGNDDELIRLKTGMEAEMKALLTEEQYAKYMSTMRIQEEREKRMSNRIEMDQKRLMEGGVKKSSNSDEMIEKIALQLEMDEVQTEKFNGINLKYKEEIKAVKGDRKQIMDSMNTLRTKKQAEMKEILSTEQFELYMELMNDLKMRGKF